MKTLFHFPLCPFSRKVRLVLAEKKIPFSLENEPIWKKREEFLDLNPAGQVPVLIDGDFILPESQAIIEYLEETNPLPALMPSASLDRARVRHLCHYIDGNFYQEVTHKIVYEKTLKRFLESKGPDSQALREGNHHLALYLDYFSWLIEKRYWLASEMITLADFTLAAHLSCLDYMGHVPWESYPEIKAWYMRLKSRPSFQPLLADTVAGLILSPTYRNLDF